MKSYIRILTSAAALAVAMFTPQRASAADQPTVPGIMQTDIVAVATGEPSLATFVTAVKAAELVAALQEQGPFTVFAPSNEAFKKLPPGQLEDLLKPENRMKLAAILKGHIIKGRVKAADIKAGTVKSLDGKDIAITVQNGKVTFGKANVIATDKTADNGVIHQIDTVVIAD